MLRQVHCVVQDTQDVNQLFLIENPEDDLMTRPVRMASPAILLQATVLKMIDPNA